jgi:hypothetical protein
MSPNRLKLIVATAVIIVMVILMLAFPSRSNHAEIQKIIDQADRDTAAAKAAADGAAESAARAKASARDAQNRVPGSS